MSNTFSLPEDSGDHIYRGDTIKIDAAISQEGVALPLTGYTIWFTAKPDIALADGATGVIQKTLTNGIVVTDMANGRIRITIAPSDTAAITEETVYDCDIQVKSATTEVSTVAKGNMKIEIDVTQTTTP